MTLCHVKDLLWQAMPEGREKYQAYLCSREWAERKEAIHKRSGGLCERCHAAPVENVHHLTYARKYRELLTDLTGWCQACHDFTHGKSDYDPATTAAAALLLERVAPEMCRNVSDAFRYGRSIIVCPFCGCDNCHMSLPREGSEGNQGTIVISMQGECPHEWDLVLVGHKGTLEMFIRNGRNQQHV